MPVVPLLLAAASLGAIGLVFLGALVRRRLSPPIWGAHQDVTSAVFQTGGTIYAVFLAFLVVAVWQSYDAAHTNVADEASVLTTLYRGTAAMEPRSGAALRGLVRSYTEAVIGDEWAVQARIGGASEDARAASLAMFRVFGTKPDALRQSDAAIDGLMLGLVARLQADRNKRTLQASETISPVIWAAAIGNGLLVVIMSFLLHAERLWPQVVTCGLLATMISTLLCIVLVLEKPFGGFLPLQPDAFVHSRDVYDSVDKAR